MIKRIIVLTAFCLFLRILFVPGSVFAQNEELDVKALVRKVETQYQGDTSHSIAIMKIITEHWNRELKMEMWSEGRDKFLVKILEPQKEAGTATLKIGDEMWNYLPKIDRLIKIPSSLMGDSWMGSHYTNDDLVKENKVEELYTLSLKSREGDQATITGVPKPDAAVVWGKIEYTVDVEKMIPVEILYYDEDGELVRTITFDQVKKVHDRWLPLHVIIQPEEKPDERTEMTYESIEFGADLRKDLFSIRSLRSQ